MAYKNLVSPCLNNHAFVKNFKINFSHIKDQAIKSFFSSFDRNFKGIARTLKMHILEDHMLQWLSMHQAGCGLMGEQGAESIHAKFNSSLRTYSAIKDPVAKMKSILHDHYLSISPHVTSALPLPKKRKLKKTST